MTRFAGAVEWREGATRPGIPSPIPVELLGQGALDCSPRDGAIRLGLWAPGAASLSRRSLATSAEATVLFAGYLLDLPAGCPGEADFVLAHYRNADWGWLRSANGVFALAAIDHERRRCTLAVDRLGIRPLLFAADESGVAFANDLAAVAAWRPAPRAVDHDAVQELVAIGFPLGDRTALLDVQRVPPGSWIELTPGGRRVTRYWSVAELPAPRPQPLEGFVDESRVRLREAIVRLARLGEGPSLCLLSSGYDSRRILLEGHAVGVPFETMSVVWPYGARDGTSIDPPVIEALCRRLGVAGHLVPAPGPAEREDLERDRRLRDALLDFQVAGRDHIWVVPLLAQLPTAPGRVNFDGIAGDTFFNNPFYALPRPVWGRWRLDDEMLAAIAPRHAYWDQIWQGLISRPLVDRLRDALNGLPEGPARLSYFFLLGRTRRGPALLPYGLLDLRIESVCPYLDNDVMDHAWTMDPVLKGQMRLQRVALDRHFPAFADLPSSHTAPALIPPQYLVPMDFADPDATRRFTPAELARLLGAWPSIPVLRAPARDLSVATLSMLGLGRLGGGWRHARLRLLLHALATYEMLGWANAERLDRVRRESLAWLTRRRARRG